MSNPYEAEISFDEVTLFVKGKELYLLLRLLVKWNNNTATDWDVRAKLTGSLKKLRITVEEPQSPGTQAFIRAIVRDVLSYKVIRQVLLVTSKLKLPDTVESEFTIKDGEERTFNATIDYPPPTYTMGESKEDGPEEA